MGELIAVLSGKGGTGKTSVCAGIASALAFQGESVLCIDCDIGLRNLDIALGITQLDALSFQEVLSYGLDRATKHPDFPQLHFLTAGSGNPAGFVTKDFQRIGEETENDAFFLGVLDFLQTRGKFCLRATIDDGDFRTETAGAARGVHGDVAAADHGHTAADLHRRVRLGEGVGLHQVDAGEEFVG